MRSAALTALGVLTLVACDPFGIHCDEQEVVSCLEDACAKGELVDVVCDCVAKGQAYDGETCSCKSADDLTLCTGDDVDCEQVTTLQGGDTMISSCEGTCDVDFDCEQGKVCDARHGVCIPGCRLDTDCEDNQECRDRACVPKP